MSTSYHIRVRGKVHGPVTLEKLKQLVIKGQLNRSHEISRDGQSWQAASSVPELFDRPKPKKSEARAQAVAPTTSVISEVSNSSDWYYSSNGNKLGPVSMSALKQLIANGGIGSDCLVWKDGLQNWCPVNVMPEFISDFTSLKVLPESTSGFSPAFVTNPYQVKNVARQIDASTSAGARGDAKSKSTAIVLALLLGTLGIHHFYLGNSLRGILMLVLALFGIGIFICPIVALVEAILIWAADEQKFQTKWCNLGMSFS